MKTKGKVIIGVIIGIMVAAIIFGIVYAIVEKNTRTVDMKPYLTSEEPDLNLYYSANSGIFESVGDVYLFFDSSSDTYIYYTGATAVLEGKYSINGNEVITSYSDDSMDDIKFITINGGNAIFFESNVCRGKEIPDTDTFNVTATRYDSQGSRYKYKFKDDGTYTLTINNPNKNSKSTLNGTYKRISKDGDNNYLDISLNGKQTLPMYIFEGHLVTNIFSAITAEEHDAAILQSQLQ